MSEPQEAITGVKLRRVTRDGKKYVELLVGDTLLRMDYEAAFELCSSLYEACTNEKLERLRLRAMVGDTKLSKRKN